MVEFSLVDRNVSVSKFNDHITCLAVVNGVQNRLVSFLRPFVRHELLGAIPLEIVCKIRGSPEARNDKHHRSEAYDDRLSTERIEVAREWLMEDHH
jgi:hypothetical protein